MIATGSMGRQLCISCFDFFDGSSEVLQIHRGPIHIPPDSSADGRWPFAITLPRHPDLASLKKGKEDEKIFLPLSDIASQELPPTFSVKERKSGRYTEGFVQYYLEATMHCSSNQQRALISRKKHREFQAVQPLHIQANLSPIPITDFSLKPHSEPKQRLVSQRLVTGLDSRLDVGQHIQKMLKSSQVPGYSFSLQLDFATNLQIENPNPIPLRLRANTIWADTSEILQAMPPQILVTQFTLTLLSTALCTCKWFNAKWRTSEGVPVKSSFPLAEYTWAPGPKARMLMVPQDDTDPLDLGIALGIRSPRGSRGANIYPTFTTSNIRTSHSIEWKMTLTIGGETAKYSGRQPVTLMGPGHKS